MELFHGTKYKLIYAYEDSVLTQAFGKQDTNTLHSRKL